MKMPCSPTHSGRRIKAYSLRVHLRQSKCDHATVGAHVRCGESDYVSFSVCPFLQNPRLHHPPQPGAESITW